MRGATGRKVTHCEVGLLFDTEESAGFHPSPTSPMLLHLPQISLQHVRENTTGHDAGVRFASDHRSPQTCKLIQRIEDL